jgi:hypothetical protein
MSAKSTFALLSNNFQQSDVINRRKSKIIYCNTPSLCNRNKIIVANSYDTYYTFNNAKNLIRLGICNQLQKNKYNLVAGLYSKMKLDGICTVTNGTPCTSYECTVCTTPTAIDNTKVFYENYTIDPKGLLFGNNQCGLNNYSNFMTFTP